VIFTGRVGHWSRLRKGDSRLLVLEALRKRPMHGYEVAKEISQMFKGLYQPSPGAVYPTLQWLEDEGYVRTETVDGRRVYSITVEGLNFLEEKREKLTRLMDSCSQMMDDERAILFMAGRRLAQMVIMLWSEGDEAKLREAASILDEARRKIVELMLR
jgi:DNA-binding PadR family transcriptional regulator